MLLTLTPSTVRRLLSIGNFKRVGKVWQITACDAASSYGVAAIPALTPQAAATSCVMSLPQLCRTAGWPIQRVLTDGGRLR